MLLPLSAHTATQSQDRGEERRGDGRRRGGEERRGEEVKGEDGRGGGERGGEGRSVTWPVKVLHGGVGGGGGGGGGGFCVGCVCGGPAGGRTGRAVDWSSVLRPLAGPFRKSMLGKKSQEKCQKSNNTPITSMLKAIVTLSFPSFRCWREG